MLNRRSLIPLLLLIILLCWPRASQAQPFRISGSVTDSLTGEPLAFVNIVVNHTREGGRTDIDGRFSLNSSQKPESLQLSYIGYAPKTVFIDGSSTRLDIRLRQIHYELAMVEILPGENPVHRIIRKIIQNRPLNDPDLFPAYTCSCYNKITAEWKPGPKYYEALEQWKADSSKADSSLMQLVNSRDERHLMLMESKTHRAFLAPDHLQETILANRVSGFRRPDFAPLATDLQPFSFYAPQINLNTGTVTGYQNPLAPGAIGRYGYLPLDTLYEDTDSIYVISFYPLPGKTFNALKGVAYINTHGYAIQYISASPAETGLWSITVEQQYHRYGETWFPEQLNYEWLLPKYPNEKLGLLLKGRSYLSPPDLSPGLRARDFGPDQVRLSDSALRRNAAEWQGFRSDSLNSIESETYQYMDSLGRRMNFDYYTRAVPALMEGFLPVGPLELSIDKLYNFNDLEGHRIGLGIRTGTRISRWFTLGGYVGYGFSDKRYKYGGDIFFRLWRKHDWELYGRYRKDVQEPGLSNFTGFRKASYWYDMIGDYFDWAETAEAGFRFRTFRFLESEISFLQTHAEPQYNYTFQPVALQPDTVFNFTEMRLALRYTVRDEITQAFGQRYSSPGNHPVFYFTLSKGFRGILHGEFDYFKAEAAISEEIDIRNVGRTSLLLMAGQLWGDVPFSLLFRGRGSYGGDLSFYLRNSFQTMRPGEFASDRYLALHFTHNFGGFLFRGRKFKPELSLAQNILYGDLRHPDYHLNLPLTAPSKGFFESGLIIDNLLRIKLLNLAYLGIGLGGFYRYGAYAFPEPIKNLTGKLCFRITGG